MTQLSRNVRRARLVAAPAALVAGLALVAASCTGGVEGTASADEPAAPVTTPPVTPTTVGATTTPPATAPTTAPVTAAPVTAAAAVEPLPPMTVPSNVEVVGAFGEPVPVVGTRSGEATKVVQMRLLQLGFWNNGPDGQYGLSTKQAVMAFQKYLGLPATGAVDEVTAAFMTNFDQRAHGLTDTGDIIEVDKTRQLLFIVKGGKTLWTLNTSTGNGLPYEEPDKNTPGEIQTGVSLTPDGLWRVNRERPEGWWEGDLGEIYRPKYFRGGVAVHGSNSIPNYPASHGCVRVSVPAMDFIWEQDLMPMKTTVWVHGG